MRALWVNPRFGKASRHVAWIALGFFGMLLVLALVLARVGAGRLLEAARWYGTLTHGERSIRWDGLITLRRVKFIPHGSNESGMLSADRVTIDAGGLLGLMRMALERSSADRMERRRKELEASGSLEKDEVPPIVSSRGSLLLSAEKVSFGESAAPAQWMPWLDPSTGVLFATLGCREATGLSQSVASRVGDEGSFDVKLQLKQNRQKATVGATLSFGGLSSAAWEGEFLLSSKVGLLTGDWRQWQMAGQTWVLLDRTFVRARNRECARRLELQRPQFIARHAIAVERQLAEWQIALPEPLEHAYREHAGLGGEIRFVSRPKRPVRLGEYQLMSRSQRLGALEAEVTVAGRRLPLLLEFLPDSRDPAAIAAALPPAIDTGEAEVPSELPAATAVASFSDVIASSLSDAPAAEMEVPVAATETSDPLAIGTAPVDGVDASGGVVALSTPRDEILPTTAGVGSSVPSLGPAPPDTLSGPSAERLARAARLEASKDARLGEQPAIVERPPVAIATLPSQGNYRGLLGRNVTITTTYGTNRTGKIRIANAIAVTLEMQTRDGPIQLRIPAEQIVRVRTVRL